MTAAAETACADSSGYSHRKLDTGRVRLHCVEAGGGAPVLLLHGFPEFWYSWRHQLRGLAEAGFHAIAPDLRGYNESDRPAGVHRYRLEELLGDVAGLIRGLDRGPVFLVGHDWGGVLAWRFAAGYPGLVRRLAVLNAPHPAAYREQLRRNPGQWIRSWYVLFFQLPWLPEWLLRVGDFALLERTWRRQPVHPTAFSERDLAEYKRTFRGRGALTGPLNYYRAALRYSRDLHRPPQVVRVPTLVIWGERDAYLSVCLLEGLERWATDLRVERLADASHWVQNDVPERVNRLLIDFFTGLGERGLA